MSEIMNGYNPRNEALTSLIDGRAEHVIFDEPLYQKGVESGLIEMMPSPTRTKTGKRVVEIVVKAHEGKFDKTVGYNAVDLDTSISNTEE